FKAVEATAGFHQVNQQVTFLMSDWMISSGKSALHQISDPDDRFVSNLQNNLAILHSNQGKYKEAEEFYRESLEPKRRVLGNLHRNTLNNLNNLGDLLRRQGKYEEAEVLLREALVGLKETAGEDHPDTLLCTCNLANLMDARGKYEEAESLHTLALESRIKVL